MAERSLAGSIPGPRWPACQWGGRKKHACKISMGIEALPSPRGARIKVMQIPAMGWKTTPALFPSSEALSTYYVQPHCPGCTPAPSRHYSMSVTCGQLVGPTYRGEIDTHRGHQPCGPRTLS